MIANAKPVHWCSELFTYLPLFVSITKAKDLEMIVIIVRSVDPLLSRMTTTKKINGV